MNTQSLFLTVIFGLLSLNGFSMEEPGLALPSKRGHLTQLSEAKFIDLNKVTLISGEIHIKVQSKDRVFPLSKRGRQEAITYLKGVLKNPPSPNVGMAYSPTAPNVYTCVRFDEKVHILYQNKKPLATDEIDQVDKTLSESIAFLQEILELVR